MSTTTPTTTIGVDELEAELSRRRDIRERQRQEIGRKIGEAKRCAAQAKIEAEHEIRAAVSHGRDHDTTALRERMTAAERIVEENTLALRQVDAELAALNREHETMIAEHREELVELAVAASGHASETLADALQALDRAFADIAAADRAWTRAWRGVPADQLDGYRQRIRGFAADASRPLGSAADLIVLDEKPAAHGPGGVTAYYRPIALLRDIASKVRGWDLAPRAYLAAHGGDRGQGMPGIYASTVTGGERTIGPRDTAVLGSHYVEPDEHGLVQSRRLRDLSADEARQHALEVRRNEAVIARDERSSASEPDQYDRARGVELDSADEDSPQPFMYWLGEGGD